MHCPDIYTWYIDTCLSSKECYSKKVHIQFRDDIWLIYSLSQLVASSSGWEVTAVTVCATNWAVLVLVVHLTMFNLWLCYQWIKWIWDLVFDIHEAGSIGVQILSKECNRLILPCNCWIAFIGRVVIINTTFFMHISIQLYKKPTSKGFLQTNLTIRNKGKISTLKHDPKWPWLLDYYPLYMSSYITH